MTWAVMCDGVEMGRFDDQEDADGMANAWNAAYPPPTYAEFTVEEQP